MPKCVSLDQRRTKCDSTNTTKPEVSSGLAENQPKAPFFLVPSSFKPISMIYILLKSLPVVYKIMV